MRSLFVVLLVALSTACAPTPALPAHSSMPTCPPISSASSSTLAVAQETIAPPKATATTPTPPAAPEPPPLTAAFHEALDQANQATAAGDFAAADRHLAVLQSIAGNDAHMLFHLARARAIRFAYANDFERAAATFIAVIPILAKHPELSDEFWCHNAMMMIRAAEGDPAAALAENDQATLAAARGTWEPKDRETLAFQKDRWHRAYLSRMLAESRKGTAREALIQYAQAALDDYRTRGFDESVAVLDAYFAALDGKRDAALAAAKHVDPAKDDDLEDLYLVVVGLEAGGDHAGAEAVRRAMRQPSAAHMSRPIMLRWLELDAKGRGFTPWHAASAK